MYVPGDKSGFMKVRAFSVLKENPINRRNDEIERLSPVSWGCEMESQGRVIFKYFPVNLASPGYLWFDTPASLRGYCEETKKDGWAIRQVLCDGNRARLQ